MNFRKKFAAMALLAAIGFVCAVTVAVGPATALSTIAGATTTTQNSSTVSITDATVTVNGKTVAASDVQSGKITILSYIKARGMAKRLVSKLKAQGKCRWIGKGTNVPVFTNSGARGGTGQYGKFEDSRRTFVCHTGKGPSGWQKVFDINPSTGEKENFCDNFIWFKLLKHLIHGQIIMARSFAHVKVTVGAQVSVYVQDTCGHASASAWEEVKIALSAFMRAHGNVTADMFGQIIYNLKQSVAAGISCQPTTTSTTTTQTTTTTTTTTPTPTIEVNNVTSPQEADNDGETYPNLYGDVYSPNGDSITCTVGVFSPNDHTQSGLGSIYGQRSFTITSHGYDRIGPYTYQAPNDGTNSDVGQYDQIGITCHDNTNSSVQNATGYSKPFEIVAPNPNPAAAKYATYGHI